MQCSVLALVLFGLVFSEYGQDGYILIRSMSGELDQGEGDCTSRVAGGSRRNGRGREVNSAGTGKQWRRRSGENSQACEL